jgi:hypothetical protein
MPFAELEFHELIPIEIIESHVTLLESEDVQLSSIHHEEKVLISIKTDHTKLSGIACGCGFFTKIF